MIFALPLYDDNPIRRAPVVTWALIGLCSGAFFWELGQDYRQILYSFGMIPAVLFGSAHLAPGLQVVPPWATVLTSMFLHGGWFHLIGNMIFLWIFGNNIEDALGHVRYVILYFCCGVAAALVQAASSPASHVPMVGASGAIAGVLGAYLLYFPRANVHVFVWIVIFFRILNVPAYILLGLWFLMELVSGLLRAPGTPGVAFWAHVGGFVAGVVLAVVLRPPGTSLLRPPRGPGFAAVPPGAFHGRRTFHRGSVPSAGRPYRPKDSPWGKRRRWARARLRCHAVPAVDTAARQPIRSPSGFRGHSLRPASKRSSEPPHREAVIEGRWLRVLRSPKSPHWSGSRRGRRCSRHYSTGGR